MGYIWGRNQNDKKNEKFRYFSIKSYVVDMYLNRLNYNTHPKHMILWRTYDNQGKNTVFLLFFFVKIL